MILKPEYNTKILTIRVPPSTFHLLEDVAKKSKVNISELVRHIFGEWLKKEKRGIV